jgi:hypothetical protein
MYNSGVLLEKIKSLLELINSGTVPNIADMISKISRLPNYKM